MNDTTVNEKTEVRALGAGINLAKIRDAKPRLESLCHRKIEAAEEFTNAVQIAALESGLLPGVLSQYITSVCTDTVRKKARSAEQLSLLFGEEI